MKIPQGARVQCTDGLDGIAVQVIVACVVKITHAVVEGKKRPHIERLVPAHIMMGTIDEVIYLNSSRQDLCEMIPLIEAEFLWTETPGFMESPLPPATVRHSQPPDDQVGVPCAGGARRAPRGPGVRKGRKGGMRG